MKILIYVEPRIDIAKPYLRLPWVNLFSSNFINTVKQSDRADEIEVCLAMNEALDRKTDVPDNVVTKVFTQEELLSPFGGDGSDIAISWYKEDYTDEQLSYYVSLMRNKFTDFIPDIIISFSPAPFFKKAFPDALFLHHEYSIFSRTPYPMAWYFDPLGIYISNSSSLNTFRKDIYNMDLDFRQQELLDEFRDTARSLIREKSPFDEIVLPFKDKFDYLVFLPLKQSHIWSFEGPCKVDIKSQYHYLVYVLNHIPENIGLVVTAIPDFLNPLEEQTIEFLRNKYPNFLIHEDFEKYNAPAQFILSYVDAVILVNSSISLQSLLWDVKVINLGDLDMVADASDLEDIEETLRKKITIKDKMLYWILTRYAIQKKYLHDPQWLSDYLFDSLNKFRHRGIDFDFYAPIDGDESIFKSLIDGLDENIPQVINKRLNRPYEELKCKYSELEAKYDDLFSKDIYLVLEETINQAERLFSEGNVDEAEKIFKTMLEKNNKITGTVMNNLAVIHAHKGNLDVAEWFINYVIDQGYYSEDAKKNLEMIQHIRLQQ